MAASLYCAGSAAAVAQERAAAGQTDTDTSPAARTDIVVTANSRQELLDILSPGVVSVVYPDDTRGEHKSLPELLDQIPGVYVRRVSGTGQYTTTSIRGSAPSEVNIYIDGVPFNTSSEVAADISTIPIGNVERIEVYRGTTPARFSGAPLGGAINIVTKRATRLSGSISAGGRSFGGWQSAANINMPLFGGSLLFGFDTDHSDGNFSYRNLIQETSLGIVYGDAAYSGDGKPNSPYNYYSLIGDGSGLGARVTLPDAALPVVHRRMNNGFQKDNLLVKWHDDHFSAKASYTYLHRMMPAIVGGPQIDLPEYSYPLPPVPSPANLNPRRVQTQKQFDIALGWRQSFGKLDLGVTLNLMRQDKRYDNLDRGSTGGVGTLFSDYNTLRYGAQFDAGYALATGPLTHLLELHLQASRETMNADANDVAGSNAPPGQIDLYRHFRRTLVNVQAQDTITIRPLGDLQVTPIYRIERLFGPTLGPVNNLFGPSSGDYGWKPTFGVSAKKKIGKGWLIFANTGTYNRYPNFYEIYGDGLFVQAGSSFLRSLQPLLREHGRNTDAGFGWNGTLAGDLTASFRTTYFRRKTLDTITLYSTPIGAKYINSGDTLTNGGEFEGNLVWGKRADLQVAATVQSGHYVKGSYYLFGGMSALERVGNNRLYTLQAPRQTASARLNLHFLGGALTTFVEGKYTGKRYVYQDVNPLGAKTLIYEAPLTTIDLGAHYRFANGVKLSAGVNDVFDQGPKQELKGGGPRLNKYYKCDPVLADLTSDFSCFENEVNAVTETFPDRHNVLYPQQGRTFYFTIAKSFGASVPGKGASRNRSDRPDRSWTGFHAGMVAGRGWQPRHAGELLVFDTNGDGNYGDTVEGASVRDSNGDELTNNAFHSGFDGRGVALGSVPGTPLRRDRNRGVNYGFRGGYDRQIGAWVIGAVAEWSAYDLTDAVSGYGTLAHENQNGVKVPEAPASYALTRRLKSIASLRGRAGLSLAGTLGYATVGVARGDVDHAFATTNSVNAFAERDPGRYRWGYQYGAGIERRVIGGVTLGVEYLHTGLRDGDYTIVASAAGNPPIYNGFNRCGTAGTTRCSPTGIRRSQPKYEIGSLRLTVGYRF